MKRTNVLHALLILVLFTSLPLLCGGETALEKGFRNPPEDAKPWTWYHWVDGNVSREGIRADLQAMKKAGIGGFIVFDVSLRMPRGKIRTLSKEWYELIRYTIETAAELGLKVGFHNCPGWSTSGGPWVRPEDGMKELLITETQISGGKKLILPRPKIRNFLSDTAVLAFPTLKPERPEEKLPEPKLSSNIDFSLNPKPLPWDFSRKTGRSLEVLQNRQTSDFIMLDPLQQKESVVLTFEYPRAVTANRLELRYGRHSGAADYRISCSEDGLVFTPLADYQRQSANIRSFSFQGRKARFYRLEVRKIYHDYLPVLLASARFFPEQRIPNLDAKVFRTKSPSCKIPGTFPVSSEQILDQKQILDLTGKLDQKGTLHWMAPEGRWTILRFSTAFLNRYNHPTSASGRGLECDKLSPRAVENFWNGMPAEVIRQAGALCGRDRTLAMIQVDSYEAGTQNWTTTFPADFRRLRGYDMLPYLPVLSGRYVGSPERSERFLEDYRRTVSDLYAEAFGKHFGELAHRHHLDFVTESYGAPFDEVLQTSYSDIPMGEFWKGGIQAGNALLASNAARISGKKYVQMECFTANEKSGRWSTTPASLKQQGDYAFSLGVNRFVFHSYVHQPFLRFCPGLTLMKYGFHFNRNNTMWKLFPGWIAYVTRCQYLLQQGNLVSDVLYLGDDRPPCGVSLKPELPFGYQGACLDRTAFLERLSVKNGKFQLSHGAESSLLIVPFSNFVGEEILRELLHLAEEGGTILLGPKPERAPGLSGYPHSDTAVRALADKLWGTDGRKPMERKIGKGRVFSGLSPKEVLKRINLPPDLRLSGAPANQISFLHRRCEDGTDIYFITNASRRKTRLNFTLSLRSGARVPELFDAESGSISACPIYRWNGKTTEIPLRLEWNESVFLVFRMASARTHLVDGSWKPQKQKEILSSKLKEENGAIVLHAASPGIFLGRNSEGNPVRAEIRSLPGIRDLSGEWTVKFPENSGIAGIRTIPRLHSLSESPETEIRYFSGTAEYKKSFPLSAEELKFRPEGRWILDLGEVCDGASVRLNGRDLGILWKPPFRCDVTDFLVAGENQLTVDVTNRWINRLIGDEQLPPDAEYRTRVEFMLLKFPDWFLSGKQSPTGRRAFAIYRHWKKNDPLQKSGLPGPVRLIPVRKQELR